ncbi:MAG: dTDP-4-amino-4,6-dideoxygalactose transaminase [Pirellulales bacterium]|nr:dTDP-4-amino-4,6-dideoxygalactose transaminase [Pirellulales bacterium]
MPFNKPFIAGKELYYIAQAVAFGNIAGDGVYTKQCTRILEEQLGIHRVLMTPSGTAALEMAAILCEVGPGDEVILPSYTFVSTANAFVRQGATPVFVDIRPDTLNLDENLIEPAITDRTKVICPVHYAGIGCEMDRIMEIAKRHGLLVVEDAAQGVNAFYRGRALGSIGHLGAYSFHETKNYICGEGGALCINDERLVRRAEIIRDKGTNRQQFFRGAVDKYTWVDVGSSYVPSEIASAFLFGQLEMLAPISRRRREIFESYAKHLEPLISKGLLRGPVIPRSSKTNYHMYYVLLPDQRIRDALMDHLRELGIMAVFHYVPLHASPMGKKLGRCDGPLPVTDDMSGRLLRLPFYHELTRNEQTAVVDAMVAFFKNAPPDNAKTNNGVDRAPNRDVKSVP